MGMFTSTFQHSFVRWNLTEYVSSINRYIWYESVNLLIFVWVFYFICYCLGFFFLFPTEMRSHISVLWRSARTLFAAVPTRCNGQHVYDNAHRVLRHNYFKGTKWYIYIAIFLNSNISLEIHSKVWGTCHTPVTVHTSLSKEPERHRDVPDVSTYNGASRTPVSYYKAVDVTP